MKISIKTRDIELEYQDEYSRIEISTAEAIYGLIRKIQEDSIRSAPFTITNWDGVLTPQMKGEPTESIDASIPRNR